MNLYNTQVGILEKPEYFDVVLSILVGNDYASGIARTLGKKQPTITEQLNTLEKQGIVEVIRREKSKRFRVRSEILCEYTYSMIEIFRDFREKDDVYGLFTAEKLKEIDRKSIEEAVPCDLIMSFFEYYAVGRIDLGIGGKVKNIGDIIIAFFGALDSLGGDDKKEISYLKREFSINSKVFDSIVELMSFESFRMELVAITTLLDTKKRERKT